MDEPARRDADGAATVTGGLAVGILLAGVLALALMLGLPARLASAGVHGLDRLANPATRATYGDAVLLEGGGELPPVEVTTRRPRPVLSATPGQEPTRGNRLVGARVSVHNVGELAWVGTRRLVVHAVDADGRTYAVRRSVTRTDTARALPSSLALRPGETRRGVLVFEVPRDARITVVRVSVTGDRTRSGAWSARH